MSVPSFEFLPLDYGWTHISGFLLWKSLISSHSTGKDCQAIWSSPETRAFYHVILKVVQADVPHIKANSSLVKQKASTNEPSFGLFTVRVWLLERYKLGMMWCPTDSLNSFVLITVLYRQFTRTFSMCLMCSTAFQRQKSVEAFPVHGRMCSTLKH